MPPCSSFNQLYVQFTILNGKKNVFKELFSHHGLCECSIVIRFESKKKLQGNNVWNSSIPSFLLTNLIWTNAAEVGGIFAQLLLREWLCQTDSLPHIRRGRSEVQNTPEACWEDKSILGLISSGKWIHDGNTSSTPSYLTVYVRLWL